jgi:branched-chain amino acid transport system substrate-binding protein
MSRIRWAVAVTAALSLGLTACAPGGGDSAGEGDGPIKIGIIADLTGATGDVGAPYNGRARPNIDYFYNPAIYAY